MPKDYFKIDHASSLEAVPRGGHVHVVGVCGVAMAQLAVVLSERGFKVTGSDKEFYEPMGSLLRSSAVKTYTGYDRGNVSPQADLVVIGNAISYGNPEVDVVEELKLRYTCFPKILDELIIGARHSIVVTGTHGKSTTTAMIASLLHKLALNPSYFIGGIAEDLPDSLHHGEGPYAVLEGDEYDSAFFAKVPKFTFYHPDTCIVNAIEFDHADIYPDLETINREFDALILSRTAAQTAICCPDLPNVKSLVAQWKQRAKCKIITFGEDESCDFRISSRRQQGFSQQVKVSSASSSDFEFHIHAPGIYNARNALAAIIAAENIGIDRDRAIGAIGSFTRVKRRQEVRFSNEQVTLIEDFAHHPTAVTETITAVREAFPDRTLWAIFEPRSNTSRRKIFQQEYLQAFTKADRAILAHVTARAIDSGQELLDVAQLCQDIAASGTPTECIAEPADIRAHVLREIGAHDVVLVMSNGSFGGLIQQLADSLAERYRSTPIS